MSDALIDTVSLGLAVSGALCLALDKPPPRRVNFHLLLTDCAHSLSDELCFLSIAEASRQIAARALSPVALAEAYLARIAAIDPQLNAYITVTTDLALQQASAADAELQRGVNRGRLHGIPFGMKDMVDTAGILTTAHSRLLAHNYPARGCGSGRSTAPGGCRAVGEACVA